MFNFTSPASSGTIDESAKTVALTVPFGTVVTSLVPSITHSGASISPASGTAQDFTAPVIYTVTAADSSKQDYLVTVTVAPAQVFVIAASVTGSGGEISPLGNVNVTQGANQTFTITPDIGYSISSVLVDGSADNAAKTAKQKTFTNVTAAHTIIVSFVVNQYTLNTTVTPSGSGTIALSPATGQYKHDTSVTLTAIPDSGYQFDSWSGSKSGSANPVSITMDGAKSVTATFALLPPTVSDPSNATVNAGQTAVFSVTAGGAPVAKTYQWQKRPSGGTFTNISGATSSSYTTPPTASSDNGATFQCIVTNGGGSVISNHATLTVRYLQISTQPIAQTVVEGGSVSLTVVASANPAPSYLWQKKQFGGSFGPISGATSATYTIAQTKVETHYADYRCLVSNTVGTDTSDTVKLQVTFSGMMIVDGVYYQTVQIGNQVWMKENLRATKYTDGSAISLKTFSGDWFYPLNPTSGYCWYFNEIDWVSKPAYGGLYNWYVVDPSNPKKIAPTGWRVPTDSDWTMLSTYLGGNSIAGGKMKAVGTTHWLAPNIGATDSSGFSALPTGYRWIEDDTGPSWPEDSVEARWWSATAVEGTGGSTWPKAYSRGVDSFFSSLFRFTDDYRHGNSIRLIRN